MTRSSISVNMDRCRRSRRSPPPARRCSRSRSQPTDAEQLAAALKVIADPARLRLLSLIQAQPGHEACVCHLTEPLGLSQPTVSHHLKVLLQAGLVEREQRGSWAYFRVREEPLAGAARAARLTAAAGGNRRARYNEHDRRGCRGGLTPLFDSHCSPAIPWERAHSCPLRSIRERSSHDAGRRSWHGAVGRCSPG